MKEWLHKYLSDLGIQDAWLPLVSDLVIAVALTLGCFLAHFIARRVTVRQIHRVSKKTKSRWDDILGRFGVFTRLSHVAPALLIFFGAHLFTSDTFTGWLQRMAAAYILAVGAWSLHAFLNAVGVIYRTTEASKTRPIRSYVQTLQILLTILTGVLIIATLLNQSPMAFVTGFGALSAVLMLVFRDSILGLVAGIQLSANDMVRIGDWIEMSKYGADGDVIDVSLNTVKVQNFDKTITMLPTYTLISDSFRNWRGMNEAGGRRIKRALMIDLQTVKFCDEAMLDRLEKYEYVGSYIRERRKEVDAFNQDKKVDTSIPINGRRITNIGSFRAYILGYLKKHPSVHQAGMTFLVRQLAPSEKGLPLEIYVFANDTQWVKYEGIQSDIFDHLLAAASWFDLAIFQAPSGRDVQALRGKALLEPEAPTPDS